MGHPGTVSEIGIDDSRSRFGLSHVGVPPLSLFFLASCTVEREASITDSVFFPFTR